MNKQEKVETTQRWYNAACLAAARECMQDGLTINQASDRYGLATGAVSGTKIVLESGDADLIRAVEDGQVAPHTAYRWLLAGRLPATRPELRDPDRPVWVKTDPRVVGL